MTQRIQELQVEAAVGIHVEGDLVEDNPVADSPVVDSLVGDSHSEVGDRLDIQTVVGIDHELDMGHHKEHRMVFREMALVLDIPQAGTGSERHRQHHKVQALGYIGRASHLRMLARLLLLVVLSHPKQVLDLLPALAVQESLWSGYLVELDYVPQEVGLQYELASSRATELEVAHSQH
jgi:hypothetical protein